LVIAAEADQSRERLLYEQALELARALSEGRDFILADGEPALTEDGRQRLALLVSPLGGIWSARNRCESLIVIALRALHQFVRDRDYQVTQGRVVFPAPAGTEGEEPTEGDEILQKLTEVKEGCAFAGRRDVLARVSVPRYLNRYLRLAGVASDVRPVARELWSLYGLRSVGDNPQRAPLPCNERVFLSTQARLDALVRRAVASHADGYALLIAMRTQQGAQSVLERLAAAGVQAGVVRGRGDADDQQTLAALTQPGTVVISCHPGERSVSRAPSAVPLHLLVLELHDAGRHVRRLCGVYAAACCEIWLSLDDETVTTLAPAALKAWAHLTEREGESAPWPSHWLTRSVQAAMEREQRLLREELLSRDVYLSDLLAFGGGHD
jgi:preprotein translocase subunit SecA